MSFAVLGREGPKQATKSREVSLSCLKGLHLHFTPKMMSGMTCNWCFRLHLGDFTRIETNEHESASPVSKDQICLLCTKVITNKDFKQKSTTSISDRQKETKAYLNLELFVGKEISSDEDTHI